MILNVYTFWPMGRQSARSTRIFEIFLSIDFKRKTLVKNFFYFFLSQFHQNHSPVTVDQAVVKNRVKVVCVNAFVLVAINVDNKYWI